MALEITKHLLTKFGDLGLIPKTTVKERHRLPQSCSLMTPYIHINKGLVEGGLTALQTNCTWPVCHRL